MKIINKKSEKSLIDEFISNFKKDYFKNKKQKKRFYKTKIYLQYDNKSNLITLFVPIHSAFLLFL